MTIIDLTEYRNGKLEFIKDKMTDFYYQEEFATECLHFMNVSKLTDSNEYNESYFETTKDVPFYINGYLFSESGERLQIFIVNLEISNKEENFLIGKKDYYNRFFSNAFRFIKKATKGEYNSINDTEPVKPLLNKLSTINGLNDIDVIEVFLLSSTISIEARGNSKHPKSFDFEDEEIAVHLTIEEEVKEKVITVKKKVIDFNFLWKMETSQEKREPLEIKFNEKYNSPLECLIASREEDFESFITVLPGEILQKIYYDHSTRLLERNVRAFLQFKKEANKNMRLTIRETPERFLAFNNGLTITATNGSIRKLDGRIFIDSLYDFQIVNGGQTTASLYFAAKEGSSLEKIKVFAKINIIRTQSEEKLEELVRQISINSNTQTKVSNVDLDSRSPYLRRIKEISDKTFAPDGLKWFFERNKGEYFTQLNTSKTTSKHFEKENPKDRVLSKEQLAKYFVAWGERPFLVKKGGEKVFKDFLNFIKAIYRTPSEIDSLFFEDLISMVILFREYEEIYGTRSNSIGQIRSATVPYAISLLHFYIPKDPNGISYFNLSEIWKGQKLNKGFKDFSLVLLKTVNRSLLNNRVTDDINEDTKKEEIWKRLCKDSEIKEFFHSLYTKAALKKMTMSEGQMTERTSRLINNDVIGVKQISSDTWFALSKWAKENGKFEAKDRQFLFQIGRQTSQSRELSPKQSKWALDLFTQSIDDGFQG